VFLFLANTITGIVIARVLGPNLRGLFAIVLLIPGYAESFGRLKYDIAAIYILGKKKATIGEMVFFLNIVAILTSLIIIGFIQLKFDWIYQQLYANTAVDMRTSTHLVLVIIPLQFVYLNYSYLIIYLEDVKSYNRMVVGKALIGSTVSIFCIVMLKIGILGALIGSVVSYIYPIVMASIKVSKIEKSVVIFNASLIWKMTKYGFQFYFGGLIAHLHQYLTNLMLVFYALPAQVGFFAMAKNQSSIITRMVPGAVNTLLFPKISKSNNQEDSSNLTLRSFRITLFILTIISICMAIVVKPMVIILYGNDYLPMVLPFWIILPGFVLSQSSTLFNSYYSGIGRPDLLPKLSLIPLGVQVGLAFYLIPRYGIIGAALAFLISSIILALVSMIIFKNLTALRGREFLVTRDDVEYVFRFVKNGIFQVIKKMRGEN
jgi:O-antigen/teichoic acid export membrane protein